ncbi:activity-regulated cytoskeleton associated protein 2-like [Teleopsis dalmanni]|uniref:activity-regulated cytoskeleton associated protein 2-like n=1 Tax=Teleopsis dalmanni TaxID=139649 RepID=UPI0018CEAB0D|nr:activity-regulated cytoskeleton associated protein 2-like [Teleopsis dalmanni]XP_037952321.1 activity-regulated cytoskeleton associated protein 2-like [Teleopsis dalmanni]
MTAVGRLTDKQFQTLIETIRKLAPADEQITEVKSKGSFSKCTTRFGGQYDHDAVDEFVTAVQTYKDVEGISDTDALKGISLLFYSQASTWWKGVRRDAKTWDDALQMLRDNFSPVMAPYQIYMEIFDRKQDSSTTIDQFICEKRALLAKLPEGLHDEATELNFIYGLLHNKYRQAIPRQEIKSFRDLLEKGRKIERGH